MKIFGIFSYRNLISDIRFTYFISALIGISYFLFNFLDVEDSSVYFSRLNYLNDGDIFIYYNGQLQFLSQLIAYLLTFFPPFFQAFGYLLFSLLTFVLFIFLLGRIIENKLLVLIFVCYLGAFFPLLFYNIMNSIWPCLFITALIPVVAYRENRQLDWRDFFLVLIFSTSQAPVLVVLPIYLILFRKTGSDFKLFFLIFWILIFSTLILPNWNSERADLLLNLQTNILFFFTDPLSFFTPSFTLKSDPPSRLVEFISFFGMIIFFFINLIRKKVEEIDLGLLLFAGGILALSFSSKIYDNFFIGPRYFVPSMIVFMIFVEPFIFKFNKILKFISYSSILLVFIVFADRYIENVDNKMDDLVHLFKGQESNKIIERGGGWVVPLGEYSKQKSDCSIPAERLEGDKFLIYCGDELGEILLR
tara:strand:+ start:1318 stop:2574 length:1257 start_codon:yes stop_codon:yes gene_type:complete